MSITPLPTPTDVSYRTIAINGADLFYREAGPSEGRTVLLLHGWPGFGFSSQPTTTEFTYTFDNIANLIEAFIDTLGITKLSMYVQDYGGPIGMRIATKRPELIRAIVAQNSNFYLEGISEALAPIAAYWKDQSPEILTKLRNFLTIETTTFQYTHGARHPERVSRDAIASRSSATTNPTSRCTRRGNGICARSDRRPARRRSLRARGTQHANRRRNACTCRPRRRRSVRALAWTSHSPACCARSTFPRFAACKSTESRRTGGERRGRRSGRPARPRRPHARTRYVR